VIGESPAFLNVLARAEQVAPFAIPVLIQGETGSGKEGVARLLHDKSGRKGRFVAINCAVLAPGLMESHLFGHEVGAFTGATKPAPGLWRSAEGGTLFLDEIGELPLELQPKLLRALDSGIVMPVGGVQEVQTNVRVVSATHQPLRRWVEEGRFRRDLHARLARYELTLPPLRERGYDIVLLAEHILRTSDVCRGAEIRLTPEVRDAMVNLPWPENVRGIQSWLEKLVIERVTDVLPCHLPGPTEETTQVRSTHEEPTSPAIKALNASRVPEPEQVILTLKLLGRASRSQLEEALGLPPRSLQYVLPRMLSRGEIRKEGATTSLVYYPAS